MRAMAGTAAMLLLSAGVMAGCLTEGRRVGGDADSADTQGDTSPDTTADTGGDTTTDTGFDSDTSDLCLGRDCDDGDPCTFDQCDPATGECSHLGVPGTGGVPTACQSPADCEDGDPCTSNTCVDLGCGAGGFCTSEVIPGCNDCASGCDDRDPCTSDVCRDNQCLHAFEEGCMANCVAGDTHSIAQIRTPGGSFPEVITTSGKLFFADLGRACNDGPTCDCVGRPGLRDGGADLVLRGSLHALPGDPEWQCESSGCTEVVAVCGPAQLHASYRVWGPGLPEWELFGGANAVPVPAQMLAGIAVIDYCLDTRAESLVGRYEGSLDIAGYRIPFGASIRVVDGALRLRNQGVATCDNCPAALVLGELDVPLVAGDGWVEFDAALPTISGATVETVRLYSNRNSLQGRYGELDGIVPFIALPPGGTMTLTRLP